MRVRVVSLGRLAFGFGHVRLERLCFACLVWSCGCWAFGVVAVLSVWGVGYWVVGVWGLGDRCKTFVCVCACMFGRLGVGIHWLWEFGVGGGVRVCL